MRATLPSCFQEKYPKTTCIIYCAETVMQKPYNLGSQVESYSQYKSHNTMKYLIATASCGLIMFITWEYGMNLLFKIARFWLLPGDKFMADRGFIVDNLLFHIRACLNIPVFTNMGAQLSKDVTITRRVENVRTHIEKVIWHLEVYKIWVKLSQFLWLQRVNKMLLICTALVNLRDDLIKEKMNSVYYIHTNYYTRDINCTKRSNKNFVYFVSVQNI